MRKVSMNNANDERQRPGRQTVYQRSGQREASPHYVLLYSDGENSGDEESIPLRKTSKTKSPPRRVEVIKVQIQPEDTLQALSLRYGSTISELKRINKIYKDNEIFAHRTIKVPVNPFSLLTELNQTENLEENGQVGNLIEIEDQPSTSREEQIINLIATPILPLPPKSDLNHTILNSLCEPSTSTSIESPESLEDGESDKLLSSSENIPDANVTDTFKCSGADWGLTWPQLVGCSVLLGLAVSFICVLYITEHSSKHHSTVG